jgi:hypothetical protein
MMPARLLSCLRLVPLAAVLVLAGCAVPIAGVPSADTGSAGASSPAEPSATGSPSTNAPLIVKPLVTGWNTVRSTKRAALYDVPPAWTVKSEESIVGFQTKDGKLLVAASGSASVGDDACGKYTSLALAAVKHSEGSDLVAASTIEAQAWADAAFRDSEDRRPTLRTETPAKITTLTGKPAVIVKVDATAPHPIGNCGTKGAAYAVSATGFTGQFGPTAILVVVANVGSEGAIPESQIRQILTTLRPEQ